MEESAQYQIRVKSHLPSQWADWFGGLTIENLPNGETTLTGVLSDQAALHGVLNRMRDIGLTLVSLNRIECHGTQGITGDERA
jgi:hypothetical protein